MYVVEFTYEHSSTKTGGRDFLVSRFRKGRWAIPEVYTALSLSRPLIFSVVLEDTIGSERRVSQVDQ